MLLFRVLVAAITATVHFAAAQTTISGYHAEDAGVTGIIAMHADIVSLNTALGVGDWAAATTAYTTAGAGAAYSIQQLSTNYPTALAGYSAAATTTEFGNFASYYGTAGGAPNTDYSDDFVMAAINADGVFAGIDAPSWGGDARKELAIKGAVLQGMWMAVVTTVEHACAAMDPAGQVDVAWALYAAGNKAPIGLAEKRAPQFDVEVPAAGPAGVSRVNQKLLAAFTALRAAVAGATTGSASCTAAVAGALPEIVGQMAVPVIQGTLRETWETSEGAAVADGAVEVAEGWAFAAAVLPLIDRCDPAAATIVSTNLGTMCVGLFWATICGVGVLSLFFFPAPV